MEKEFIVEAKKQYFRYFRIWFIAIGILVIIGILVWVSDKMSAEVVRNNTQAPLQRVYDQAQVLSAEEEAQLEALISQLEEKIKADIVLVTSNLVMEGEGAPSSGTWESNMMNTADGFYDKNGFGYDKPLGDGVLLLDNWYEGQAGSWLSTCGRLVDEFTAPEIDQVLDEVYYGIEYGSGAYEGYFAAINEIGYVVGGIVESADDGSYFVGAFAIATIAALIYILSKLRNKNGEITVTAHTYVEGSPVTNISQDQFIRRVVTRRHIPRQSSSSGTSSRGGRNSGGGVHRSSGGVRHGGGGRRR